MGRDLRLFPLDHLRMTTGRDGERWEGFSHTVLNVPRVGGVPAVRKLSADQLPRGHEIYGLIAGTIESGPHEGEHMDGRFDRDPYGDPYTWVRAAVLAKALARALPEHPSTAYVSRLPGDTMVILGWHYNAVISTHCTTSNCACFLRRPWQC